MSKDFKPGDHVEWKKIGGSTTGTVKKKITADTKVSGHRVRASEDKPQFEVATDATGKRAAHKPQTMKKVAPK